MFALVTRLVVLSTTVPPSVGLVPKTSAPEPVSSVTAAAKLAEDGVPKNAATPVPSPDTPVEIGKPVMLVATPEAGVPRAGVTKVGLVANTKAPVPVSLVTAAAKLAEDGVARNVATPEPKPDTPVLMGKPVVLVSTPEAGVPRAGVTRVGELAKTAAPVPVSSVSAAAKLADVNDPKSVALPVEVIAPVKLALVVTLPAVSPAAVPVMFVPTSADGVPRAGVTNVGDVANTSAPEPVSSVTAAARLAEDGVPSQVATPEPKDVIPVPPLATGRVPVTPVVRGSPVVLVSTPDAGVPKAGVTKVGDVANTAAPVPVSSVRAAAKLAELNEPNEVALPTDVTAPVRLALVVTLPAVKPAAVPVMFVPTSADGVPKAGVTKVGDVAKTSAPVPVSSVTAAAKLADDGVARKVATPEPKPDTPVEIGKPVALVSTPLAGVPRAGVTSVGLVANTAAPVPVSSVNAPAKLAEVNDPSEVALPTDVTAPVRLALVSVVGLALNTAAPAPAPSVTITILLPLGTLIVAPEP